MRCQVVVPGSEMGGSGVFSVFIESISFRAAAPETVAFDRFSVSLGTAANGFLEESFQGNFAGERVNVFEAEGCSFTPSGGWVSIPLEREYLFNCSDNLLIEVIYSGADGGMLYCGFGETDEVRTVCNGDHQSPRGYTYRFAPHIVISGRLGVNTLFGECIL